MEQQWEKGFHDESDVSSEDVNLTDETIKVRRVVHKRGSVRLWAEVAMAVVIVILSAILIYDKAYRVSGIKPFGPRIPERVVTLGNVAGFGPDLIYADREMLVNQTRMREIHENWQQLYPISRGYYLADESPDYVVQFPPADISGVVSPDDKRSGHVISVFHQLHCLSLITTRLGTSRDEFATWTSFKLGHTAHCIEYLRQSILCSGDTTLEGEPGAWAESIGWGQKHVCKDYDYLMKLANKRAAWNLSEARDPDHSMLFHHSKGEDCNPEKGDYCH
ncbi:hypothetical protein HIM_10350 [Hirsutella minnesotensis 3608]|uniref:Oxidase ustYa n=1 Tax=Hirsutella minnesotensis 3608 TaxID=1043627 RepID=A0A0F8A2E5_9HYPO|nr:hypothetical protein HIM_10350 [Hirsutella minnesotensis 3608]